MENFKIITERFVYDEREHDEDGSYLALYYEQQDKLKELGIKDDRSTCYVLHFFDSPYTYESTADRFTIDEGVQCLAIKDGVDLVQFDNGNYGFVAYYNGYKNGFEIIKESED